MRLSSPRIMPVEPTTETAEQLEILAPMSRAMGNLNIFRTMVKTPRALKRFNVWGSYLLGHGTSLDGRQREIAILRTGWLCHSGYEWVQHCRIGLEAGLSQEEIDAIKVGPSHPDWSAEEAAILQATDDLVEDFFIQDSSWAALSMLSEQQRMDLVYTVGQYCLVSMVLNSFGVQLDPGQTLDADFPK